MKKWRDVIIHIVFFCLQTFIITSNNHQLLIVRFEQLIIISTFNTNTFIYIYIYICKLVKLCHIVIRRGQANLLKNISKDSRDRSWNTLRSSGWNLDISAVFEILNYRCLQYQSSTVTKYLIATIYTVEQFNRKLKLSNQ